MSYKTNRLAAVDYHASEAWSQSQLKLLPSQPELFYGYYVSHEWEFEQTSDMLLGTYLHAVHLEGRSLIEIPEDVLTSNGQRRGKLWDAWKAAHEGDFYLLAKDAERIRSMSAGLMSDPKCAAILNAPGACEESYFWTDPDGMSFRARLDKTVDFGGGVLVADLKATSIDVTDSRTVARKALELGYYRQIPWYMDAVAAVTGVMPIGGGFLFVRNRPPFTARFWTLKPSDVEYGRHCNAAAVADLKRRLDTQDWHDGTHGRENEIELPPWAYGPSANGWSEFFSLQGDEE